MSMDLQRLLCYFFLLLMLLFAFQEYLAKDEISTTFHLSISCWQNSNNIKTTRHIFKTFYLLWFQTDSTSIIFFENLVNSLQKMQMLFLRHFIFRFRTLLTLNVFQTEMIICLCLFVTT